MIHTVQATLRDVRNGLVKVFTDEEVYYKQTGDELISLIRWHWLEGNYRCDCNRSLFMYGDDGELPCGRGTIKLDRLQLDGVDIL